MRGDTNKTLLPRVTTRPPSVKESRSLRQRHIAAHAIDINPIANAQLGSAGIFALFPHWIAVSAIRDPATCPHVTFAS